MKDKRMTVDEVVAQLEDGMTIGVGGWASRRKPMSLIRGILRSDLKDLTIVSYGGPEVGMLSEAGKVKKLVYGFVSLDTIPLEPLFSQARQNATVEVSELDEGMFLTGLRAAAQRLPFLPTRAGLGSDVMRYNPDIKTVRSPYGPEEFVAMPALTLDVALVHLNRADAQGNAQYLGPEPYFDDLFCMAADQAFVSVEKVVDTPELLDAGPVQSMLINRAMVDGVVEAPGGVLFTSCQPDYARDETLQKAYAQAATAGGDAWADFKQRFVAVTDEKFHQERRNLHQEEQS